MDDVVRVLRSALVSHKGPCDIQTLRRDFKILENIDVPYRKFGFASLEDMLENIPSLKVVKRNGATFVEAKVVAESKHIVDMVSKQKSSKKSGKGGFSRPPTAGTGRTNWKPAALAGKKWRPSYQSSSRPAAINHSQIIRSKPPVVIKVPSPANPCVIERPLDNSQAAAQQHGAQIKITNKPPRNNNTLDPNSKEFQPKIAPTKIIKQSIPSPRSRADMAMRREKALATSLNNSVLSHSNSLDGNNTTVPKLIRSISSPVPPTYGTRPISVEEAETNSQPKYNPSSSSSSQLSLEEISSDPVEQMNYLIDQYRLPKPDIKIQSRVTKYPKQTFYYCVIKMEGNESYSSYPHEYTTQEEAIREAAAQAVEALFKRLVDNNTSQLLLSTEKDILERIPPIIDTHTHGIWASQLKLDYVDLYDEQLPANWIALLDTLPNISVVPCLDNFILRSCKEGEKHTQAGPLASEISIPSYTLCLWEGKQSVRITCLFSAVEVWMQQLDTEDSKSFTAMMEALELFYKEKGEPAVAVNIGGFYVARIESNWSRVRVLQTESEKVRCFFLDTGDESLVPRSDIYSLERQFAKNQAQAFVCRLSGLEELANMSCSMQYLKSLQGQNFSAEIAMTNENLDDEDNNIQVPVVTLYVEEQGGTSYNYNEELITMITMDATDTQLSSNNVNRVFVSHAEPTGDIYIQVQSEGFDRLRDHIEDLDKYNFEQELEYDYANLDYSTPNVVYLSRWSQDGAYYRCSVLDVAPNKKMAQIYFIDYGNTEVVKLDKPTLFPLSLISDFLNAYPPQAHRVKMADVDATKIKDFASKILKIFPAEQPVLFKVKGTSEDGVPIGMFYKRSLPDQHLYSVNECLRQDLERVEEELAAGDTNNNNQSGLALKQKLKRLQLVDYKSGAGGDNEPVPSHGHLPSPDIPPVGGELDVVVSCAVSPWNFFVQPLKSQRELKALMRLLQERYSNNLLHPSPLNIKDVVPGRIYVSKYQDRYYRTSVIKVINSGSISVFYPDYGYYANLTLKELLPVDPEFLNLPYQAIKARLNDLKPRHQKWSMDDCQFFDKLVCHKSYYTVVKNIKKDDFFKSDLVLYLYMVDTADENEDLVIQKLLINEGIALPE